MRRELSDKEVGTKIMSASRSSRLVVHVSRNVGYENGHVLLEDWNTARGRIWKALYVKIRKLEKYGYEHGMRLTAGTSSVHNMHVVFGLHIYVGGCKAKWRDNNVLKGCI